MGSRDKNKRIRVRASKRRLNSSSSRHSSSSLLAPHPSHSHHNARGDIIFQDNSRNSSTRRSARILSQSLAAERAALVINDQDIDRDRPGPSRRSRERRRSRSRSHDEPDEDELIIAQQPEPENGINHPPRVNQDGRISFEIGQINEPGNGMRLRSGRIKSRRPNRNDKSQRISRRSTKRKHLSDSNKLPYRISHILDQDHVPKEIQVENSWSDRDKSSNIYLHEDAITLHRRPVSQSTDSIRGRTGYKSGVHVWEIKWVQTQRGTHACIGVATKNAPLRKQGYCALVGSNAESWGWDLGRNLLIHNDQNVIPLCYTNEQSSNGNTPYPIQTSAQERMRDPFVVPDKFIMALDMDAGRLGFMAHNEWLGWAFGDFQGKELFPAVSCVWGHCEVTLKYLNYSHSPLSLQELSRRSVRHYLFQPNNKRVIGRLSIPSTLKCYLRPDGLKDHQRYSKLSKRRKIEEDSDSDINQN